MIALRLTTKYGNTDKEGAIQIICDTLGGGRVHENVTKCHIGGKGDSQFLKRLFRHFTDIFSLL
jgi:hypothetical protein